jgi:DNA invertase Pin-like site-specific DNA recombinase
MAKYGYARVSSVSQSLDEQLDQLQKAGCEIIRSEKVSGKSTEGREELATMLQFLRSGDTLVVTRLDRLGRNVKDLSNIVDDLTRRGVALNSIHQSIDTSSAAGRAFIGMLSVFAEFENSIRNERQMEGIARAKASGVFKGRGRKFDHDKSADEIRRLRDTGLGAGEIAKELGISKSSVYRFVRDGWKVIFMPRDEFERQKDAVTNLGLDTHSGTT